MKLLLYNKEITNHKNYDSIIRMCKSKNIEFEHSYDINRIKCNDYDILWCNDEYISPDTIPTNIKIIYGPQFFTFPEGDLVGKLDINNKYRCVYNSLSKWGENMYLEFTELKVPIFQFPFSIDIEKFNEIKNNTNKKYDCILYIKRRTLYIINYCINILNNKKIKYVIYQYGNYEENDYINDLHNCKFMLVLDAHEYQGFALQEAMSCNIPLLVLNSTSMYDESDYNYNSNCISYKTKKLLSTSVPYWSDECGIKIINESELENNIEYMLKNYNKFNPRNYIKNTLSDKICMNRILDYFYKNYILIYGSDNIVKCEIINFYIKNGYTIIHISENVMNNNNIKYMDDNNYIHIAENNINNYEDIFKKFNIKCVIDCYLNNYITINILNYINKYTPNSIFIYFYKIKIFNNPQDSIIEYIKEFNIKKCIYNIGNINKDYSGYFYDGIIDIDNKIYDITYMNDIINSISDFNNKPELYKNVNMYHTYNYDKIVNKIKTNIYNNKITCKLQGGIGDQLFQISNVYSLSKDFNLKLYILRNDFAGCRQGSHPSKYYNNIYEKIDIVDINFNNIINIYENNFSVYNLNNIVNDIINTNENVNICTNGYFQSSKYFYKYIKELKVLFTPDIGIINYLTKNSDIFDMYPELKYCNKNDNFAFIGVIRGDYITFSKHHNPCGIDYYQNAMNKMGNKIYYIMSDDIEWVKNNFIGDNYKILDIKDDLITLFIITLFKNYIISNSTFYWWGSFLSIHDEKDIRIIAPDKWYPDINNTSLYRDNMEIIERELI